MPRRPSDESHIRKLQRTGAEGRSYVMTLPKKLVDELGWRERQKLTVKKSGSKLIIQDWKK
jgi:antitoxin component of MazEF toxin-antitoxin module